MRIVKTKTESKIHLTGLLSEPKSKSKDSIIVHVHGMAGDPYTNAWYPHFHELFPENDVAFLAGNQRGTGSITMFYQEPDKYPNYGDTFEIFEDCVDDIEVWVQFAKGLGYKNIHLQAHSLGPSKAVYYLNREKHDFIKNLILISPADMLGLTMHNKKLYEKMLSEARELNKKGRGDQLLSVLLDGEYYLSAKMYMNFFTESSNCNVFCYTDRKHDWSMVNNINNPVLVIGGTKDLSAETISSSKKALSILKKQLKNSPKVVTKLYDGAEHSFEGFEERIVKDVVAFIKSD